MGSGFEVECLPGGFRLEVEIPGLRSSCETSKKIITQGGLSGFKVSTNIGA